jgi:hypothetical protein
VINLDWMLEGERSPTAPAKLIASTDTANAIALCILDLGQEHYKRKYMSTYHEVRRLAENLTPDEQMRLIEELFSSIRQRLTLTPTPKRSILELRGLGKEIWNGIDAQEYVNQERDSWNG